MIFDHCSLGQLAKVVSLPPIKSAQFRFLYSPGSNKIIEITEINERIEVIG